MGQKHIVEAVPQSKQSVRIVLDGYVFRFVLEKPEAEISGGRYRGVIQCADCGVNSAYPAVQLIRRKGQYIFQGKIRNVIVNRDIRQKQQPGKEKKNPYILGKNRINPQFHTLSVYTDFTFFAFYFHLSASSEAFPRTADACCILRSGKRRLVLGYLNDYPGHWPQGKTVKELEETLIDLYELEQEEQPNRIPERSISASLNRRADKSGGGAFIRALTGNAVIP
jgi:hypothetical protein